MWIGGFSGEDALLGGNGDDVLDSNNSLDGAGADDARDAVIGLDVVDTCFISTQDNDFTDNTCESIVG